MAKILQRAFTGGELSPAMYGRIDDQKYQTGLAECRNMIALAQGPVRNRSGFEFVREAKYHSKPCRLIPFTFNSDQTMVLEFGDHYIRFHTDGATLLSGYNTPYEVSTPYDAEDLNELHYVQSADVVTLVHPSYPPMELRRYGAADWRLVEIVFGTPLPAPTGVTATFSVQSWDNINNKDMYTDAQKKMYNLKYRVTALKDEGGETLESEASATGACDGNVYLQNAKVTITWNKVAGATRYRIYKTYSGVYGFIGTSDSNVFEDTNIAADNSITPPRYDVPFKAESGISGINVINQGSGYSNYGNAVEPTTYTVSVRVNRNSYRGSGSTGSFYTPLANTVQTPTVTILGDAGEGAIATVSHTITGENIAWTTNDPWDPPHYVFAPGSGQNKPSSYVTVTARVTITLTGNNYTNPRAVVRWANLASNTFKDTVKWHTGGSDNRQDYTGYATTTGTYETLETVIPLTTLTDFPEVRIDDPTGYGAAAKATVTDGKITAIKVISPGTGYTNPTVTIVASKGSGATATANYNGFAGDYPGAVSYFDQRRVFAGTRMRPQYIWMTRAGTESDMSYTLPSQADNRISFRLSALEASRIQHVMPLQSLVILTNSAEFRLTTANDDAITPNSVGVKPQSYIGASPVQPVIANSTLLYATARGGHIRELGYNYQAGGFVTGDLSIRAEHLFENNTVVDMALAKSPTSTLWCAMRDGSLIGCTYLPDQAVGAWHSHDTQGGAFEAVACVAEGDEDILYAVIRRVINGKVVRYIERMHERQIATKEEGFFVDSGLSYKGAPINSIKGLAHLEGQEVAILADGKVQPRQIVRDGGITIPVPAGTLHIGLPIQSRLVTLPCIINTQDGGYGQGRRKSVTRVYVRVYRSSALTMGPDEASLKAYPARTNERYGEPPELKSEELDMVVAPGWTDSGQIYLVHDNPLPLMVCGITADVQA